MKNDKPNAAAVGMQQVTRNTAYENPMFILRRDDVRLPNGHQHPFVYVKKPPGVFIIPLTSDGKLVLIRQFRYVVDRWLWEIPAGGSNDFDGTDLTELAKKELWEETGGQAGGVRYLSTMYGASGVLDQELLIFLAHDVVLSPEHFPEFTEVIEVHSFPLEEGLRRLREEPTDALTGYAVLKYANLLRRVISHGPGVVAWPPPPVVRYRNQR